MLDLFLLKERLQIQQRSTVLVELLGIRLRPPDSDTSAWSGDRRDEGEQVDKAGLVLVSASQLACSFQKLFFFSSFSVQVIIRVNIGISSAKCDFHRSSVDTFAAGL